MIKILGKYYNLMLILLLDLKDKNRLKNLL